MFQNNTPNNHTTATRGSFVGIIVYLILAASKLIAAVIFNSTALMADGLNNFSDIIASLAVFIGLKISQRPIDEDHYFGHDKYESISSFMVSLIMILLGGQIIISSCQKLIQQDFQYVPIQAVWIPALSLILLYTAYRYIHYLNQKTQSIALRATLTDMRNDLLITATTIIGIIASQVNILWLDALISLLVGILIIKSAFDIFLESTHTLTDGFDPDAVKQYRAFIKQLPEVKEVPKIRGRISVNKIYLDVTIEVDPQMSVKDSHQITQQIELLMQYKFSVSDVDVHVEPYHR